MKKDTKNFLIIGALAVGGYMYMNPSKKERYYILNGQSVSETQLKAMGYTELRGEWWSPAMLAQAAAQGNVNIPNYSPGVNQNADNTWAIISTILNTGMQFVPLLLNNNNTTGSGSSAGTSSGGSGTGGGSSAGASSGS